MGSSGGFTPTIGGRSVSDDNHVAYAAHGHRVNMAVGLARHLHRTEWSRAAADDMRRAGARMWVAAQGAESAMRRLTSTLAVLVLFVGGLGGPRQAGAVPILPPDLAELAPIINHTRPWLFIGTVAPNNSTTPEGTPNKGVGDAVDISNFEIGAIKAPVPANQFDEDYGPDLKFEESVPNVPGANVQARSFGVAGTLPGGDMICYDGNVAVTHLDAESAHANGTFSLGRFGVSNTGVFAKNFSEGGKIPDGLPAGIVSAGPANEDTSSGGTIANNSNSMFNDVNYPNPIGSPTPTPFDEDSPNVLAPGNGITGDFDFAYLRTDLDVALAGSSSLVGGIPGLSGSAPLFARLEINYGNSFIDVLNGHVIDLVTNVADDGQIRGDDLDMPTSLYVMLRSGLNVIDFYTGGNDLTMTNANILIDGPVNSLGIFRVPTGSKFNINQGNILIGDSGIQRSNAIFFSDTADDQALFSFDDTLFYGVSFWTLGDGSGSVVNNSQGCVQFIGDKLNFQNIRYCRCCEGTVEVVPEPTTLALFGIGASCLFGQAWRRKRKTPRSGT